MPQNVGVNALLISGDGDCRRIKEEGWINSFILCYFLLVHESIL